MTDTGPWEAPNDDNLGPGTQHADGVIVNLLHLLLGVVEIGKEPEMDGWGEGLEGGEEGENGGKALMCWFPCPQLTYEIELFWSLRRTLPVCRTAKLNEGCIVTGKFGFIYSL